MITFVKKVLKTGVAAALLVGLAGVGAYALVGKDRAHAVVRDVHGNMLEAIDESIDDPSALRAQLHDMEKEYPERIAQVRDDLAELEHEIRQLDREHTVSERVVALADQDLDRLETQLATQVQSGETRLVSVSLDDHVYTPRRAQVRLQQIRNTRVAYSNRAADARHDMGYLQQQAGRLQELLTKLEAERDEFRMQIVGLSRQIDAIARNERLIGLLEKRNRTIEECSRYETVSLDQINGRLTSIRTRQEAELETLATLERQTDYEDMARMQLDDEALVGQIESLELSDL